MYGFSIIYPGSLEEAEKAVTEALAEQGFGILTVIDVKETLKAKIGADVRPYRILGACNPALAHRAIQADPDIGLLLPCNVVVREEEDGKVAIAFMDPEAVLALTEAPEVAELAREVKGRLEQVRERLDARTERV